MLRTIYAGLALLAFGTAGGAWAQAASPPDEPRDLRQGYEQDGYYPRDDYDGRYDRGYGQGPGRVRVWLDNNRDILRIGDRSRVNVWVDEDAYVAVMHIDANGDVEMLWPRTPYEDGYLQGGRTYNVSRYGGRNLSVRGGYGIGYVFAIASPEPLDYDRVRDRWWGGRAVSWSRDYNAWGDPFWAMERFERLLVPGWEQGFHVSDYYSYHVGRRYSYPRYACYDSYGPWYHSRSAYWGGCDRVRVLLVSVPYYYDTRYYRRDRYYHYGRYYRDPYYDRYYGRRRIASYAPRYGYKENPDTRSAAPPRRSFERRPEPGSAPPARAGSRGADRGVDGRDQQQEPRAAPPQRQRPTFQRRPQEPVRRESPPERSEPRVEPRRSEPRQAEPRSEPRRSEPRVEPRRSEPRAEPRRSEPRAEPRRSEPQAEPRRSEPRRESAPPSRSDGGSRSRPSESSAPRARPPAE